MGEGGDRDGGNEQGRSGGTMEFKVSCAKARDDEEEMK